VRGPGAGRMTGNLPKCIDSAGPLIETVDFAGGFISEKSRSAPSFERLIKTAWPRPQRSSARIAGKPDRDIRAIWRYSGQIRHANPLTARGQAAAEAMESPLGGRTDGNRSESWQWQFTLDMEARVRIGPFEVDFGRVQRHFAYLRWRPKSETLF